MISALKVCDLIMSNTTMEDWFTHDRIQAFLFFAQGINLSIKDEKLFYEDLYRSESGAVVTIVAGRYSTNKTVSIQIPRINYGYYNEHEIALIKHVYNVYNSYSTKSLREIIAHSRPFRMTGLNDIIDIKLLKSYFYEMIA